ncbi:MAG: single-stranded-DNA-specific exonuclease RecJ [Fibrobacteraceae bacterium]
MDELLASTIAQDLKIPHLIARLLVSRGCASVADAYSRLHSSEADVLDPYLMLNMDRAVEWVLDAKKANGKVCIFGDYDMDGMTATALLKRFFAELGVNASWKLPCRFDTGYGLSLPLIEEFAQAGVTHLVTVDTGITSIAEIAGAKEKGMHVMVVDHHQPSGDGLPPCDVLLDPCQDGCRYPNKFLCGAGVAYKLTSAVFSKLGIPDPERYLELVAMGTLADLVTMSPENRYLTCRGLSQMGGSRFPGVRELCRRQLDDSEHIGGQDVLFRIAPLMNAPGRMEKPDAALDLLLCDDATAAPALLDKLFKFNDDRKKKEAEISKASMEWVRRRYGEKLPDVLVVDGEGWHSGVIGIVSAKLANTFNRPSAVLSIQPDGVAHASARAVPGFDWHKALFDCRDLFLRWGGHANAAGFSVKRENIETLRERLQKSAAGQHYEVRPLPGPLPDLTVALPELDETVMNCLHAMEPFNSKNPYPVLHADDVCVSKLRELRGGHLQLELTQGRASFSGIAFGMSDLKPKIRAQRMKIGVSFEPMWNLYNGRRSIQLLVKSID